MNTYQSTYDKEMTLVIDLLMQRALAITRPFAVSDVARTRKEREVARHLFERLQGQGHLKFAYHINKRKYYEWVNN